MILYKALLESPVNHKGGLANMQIFRFFSVLAVSLFYVGFHDSLGRNYKVLLVNGGYIFYAISGYVTMLSTERGCDKFMLKRLIKNSLFMVFDHCYFYSNEDKTCSFSI